MVSPTNPDSSMEEGASLLRNSADPTGAAAPRRKRTCLLPVSLAVALLGVVALIGAGYQAATGGAALVARDNTADDDGGGGSGSICISLDESECAKSPACSWDSDDDGCVTASLELAARDNTADDDAGGAHACDSGDFPHADAGDFGGHVRNWEWTPQAAQ